VPVVLLGADLADAGARLAGLLAASAFWPYGPAPGILAAKLLADLLVGGIALAPVLLPWRCSCVSRGRLVLLVVFGGAVSLGLDLAGRWSAGAADRHLLASIEEGAELLLYTILAGMVFERAEAIRKEKVAKRDISPVPDVLSTRRQASC
jgi:hypothetical protein